MSQASFNQAGGCRALLRVLLRSLGLKRMPVYLTKDEKVGGQRIGSITRLYFTTRVGEQILHHSFKGTGSHGGCSVQAAAYKAIRQLCKLYKINMARLIRRFKKQYEVTLRLPEPVREEPRPQSPVPLPTPTPPSPEVGRRVTGDRQAYLRRFTPAPAREQTPPESPPVRNSWVFYSDAEDEDSEPYLSGPEWEPLD